MGWSEQAKYRLNTFILTGVIEQLTNIFCCCCGISGDHTGGLDFYTHSTAIGYPIHLTAGSVKMGDEKKEEEVRGCLVEIWDFYHAPELWFGEGHTSCHGVSESHVRSSNKALTLLPAMTESREV